MEIEAIITRFINDELLHGDGQVSLEPDASLISTGVLDSLALLRLLLFLEQQFGIKVNDGDVTPSNFETVNRIKTLVEAKTK
jgi:acyl carrier protein